VAAHTYGPAGDFPVVLAVTTPDQVEPLVESTSIAIENGAPVATLGTPGVSGRTASVTVTASDDDGTISSLSIDWGDGTIEPTTAVTRTHTYAETGTFTITLTATDNEGLTATATRLVTIDNAAPIVQTVTPAVNGVRVTLAIEASDADGTVSTVDVVWGDGTTDTGMPFTAPFSASHDYGIPATYNIVVTVTDNDGLESGTVTRSVTSGIPGGEVLHIPFDGNITSNIGPTLSTGNLPNFTSDRFNQGTRAADFHKNNGGSFPLLHTNNATIASGTAVSFSVWVEGLASLTNQQQRFVGVGDWYALYIDTEAGPGVRFGRTDGIRARAGDPFVSENFIPADNGLWHHYVGVVEQINGAQFRLRLFRNGLLIQQQTVNGTVPARPNCRFYVGRYTDSGQCTETIAAEFASLAAAVDDVRVYNRALSATEVSALFRERNFSPP
jgi:PKD repeat protein